MFAKLKGRPIALPLPVQLKEAAEFREVKLKGKNHILKTGHYRLKNELKSDHKKVEQLQEQVLSGSLPVTLEVHHRLDCSRASRFFYLMHCNMFNHQSVTCSMPTGDRELCFTSAFASVSMYLSSQRATFDLSCCSAATVAGEQVQRLSSQHLGSQGGDL